MSKTYEFLKECGVFWVSTVNNNTPAVRPFGAVMEYNNHLYISTGITKNVCSQLISNQNVQIASLPSGTRDWIRITGKAIKVDALEEKNAMLDACPILNKRFSSANDDNFALFRIDDMISMIYTDKGGFLIDN